METVSKDLMLFLYGNGSLITYLIFLGSLASDSAAQGAHATGAMQLAQLAALAQVTLFPPSFSGSGQAEPNIFTFSQLYHISYNIYILYDMYIYINQFEMT